MTGTEDRFAGSEAYFALVEGVDHETHAEAILARIASCLGRETNFDLLEVGIGTGWLLVQLAQRGIRCSGVELNPIYRDHAVRNAKEHGFDFDIRLGSVEDLDLGDERYDAVIATSVFEHVRDYRRGLENVYRALRPGGVLYFYSTNKVSLRSGEYPRVLLYGWWPSRVRFWIRVRHDGTRVGDSSGRLQPVHLLGTPTRFQPGRFHPGDGYAGVQGRGRDPAPHRSNACGRWPRSGWSESAQSRGSHVLFRNPLSVRQVSGAHRALAVPVTSRQAGA